MKWDDSGFRFPRPLRWIVCLLDEKTIPVRLAKLEAGRVSHGHRHAGESEISIPDPGVYETMLRDRGAVWPDWESRRAEIIRRVGKLAASLDAEPAASDSLYDENTGLVETPGVVLAGFDSKYLQLPEPVLVASMVKHIRCFPLSRNGSLIANFIAVVNQVDGKTDSARNGYERVLDARLSDAEFFFNQDRRRSLSEMAAGLDSMEFLRGMGTLARKAGRMKSLALRMAKILNCDQDHAQTAAVLCKVDLLSEMVGEFPDLQGVMGSCYAAGNGLPAAVCDAIGEHYRPAGESDEIPSTVTGCITALADKMDTLAGGFLLGLEPSGSEDPFALRRSATGVARICLEAGLDLDLVELFGHALDGFSADVASPALSRDAALARLKEFMKARIVHVLHSRSGISRDFIEAVMEASWSALPDVKKRAAAVQALYERNDDFKHVATIFKRVKNILASRTPAPGEEGEDNDVDENMLMMPAEKELHARMAAVTPQISRAAADGDYDVMMNHLAGLYPQVERFFEDVMVLSGDRYQDNRIRLLFRLAGLFEQVADFSRIRAGG